MPRSLTKKQTRAVMALAELAAAGKGSRVLNVATGDTMSTLECINQKLEEIGLSLRLVDAPKKPAKKPTRKAVSRAA